MTVSPPLRAARDLLCRPVPAALALIAILFVLSLGMSTGGYLGTDTGAKVATLDVMDERGTAHPVLGYWAEEYDPEGTLHPIYDSRPVDGGWVQVTTLPMLELARPLWALGGYRATLLLPILGAVGTAFACRSLAQRMATPSAGWQAYWIVGLASPITVYALDLWEHAPGVGCMVGAIALLAGIVDGDAVPARALGAGALLGLAATMRTEAFPYALVAVGTTCLFLALVRHRWSAAVQAGALSVVAFGVPWFANTVLEDQVGGNSRQVRVTDTAGGGPVGHRISQTDERLREAVTGMLAMRSGTLASIVLLGGLAAALVAGALVADRRGDRRLGLILLGGSAILHLSVLAGGLGFVPGMLSAAPVVVAALLLPPTRASGRVALVIALGTLPLVWAFHFIGGASPQWGNRYALTSAMVLVALGVAGLQRCSPQVRLGLIGLSSAITVTGLLWLSQRSHDVERLFAALVDRPEDVIVSRNGFLIREGGATYSQRLWLTAVSDDALESAFGVVDSAGYETVGVLDTDPDAPEELAGADLQSTVSMSAAGTTFYLHSYAL